MPVVTRFAPSPTGYLHIGGARTALFNWLYARHHGGVFRLRIEDTDRARSTEEAVQAIIDGLRWLGLDWDDALVRQSTRLARHAAVARELLAADHAYRCYCTPEELAEMRASARTAGRSASYDGRWRDRDPAEAPAGIEPVIRLKAPRDGETVIEDGVQGTVRVANGELDDMVLLRSDGSPTYMLSVVVDDHDMDVTHAIRGDDHLTNAFRQTQIFNALGWQAPTYAHVPLIHGADGAKLSKRHGAVALGAYRDMGFLPGAMRNALLRLGWSHGDDEIISTEQAIAWFDLDAVGRGAARFDLDKLTNLNGHYLRESDDATLARLVEERLTADGPAEIDVAAGRARAQIMMSELKSRAKTLIELAENARFLYAARPLAIAPRAAKLLGADAVARLGRLRTALADHDDWGAAALEEAIRAAAHTEECKLGAMAQPLRAALTGSDRSPGIFEVLAALGREESLGRIDDILVQESRPN